MKILKSKKLNLHIIYPRTNFKDKRGVYIETFNKKEYRKILNKSFVEDDTVISKQNSLRGIHGDFKTWKLISCLYGKCLSFIVDCNQNSNNFGRWESFLLDSDKYRQILIPPGFGNSYFVISNFAIYHYKQTNYYSGQNKQFTYNFFDPFLNIKDNRIKKNNVIISKRDKNAKYLK